RRNDMTTSLTVDVVSDIVCPWCFIGKRKLEVALGEINSSDPSLGVEVRWHPIPIRSHRTPAEHVRRPSAHRMGATARRCDSARRAAFQRVLSRWPAY